MLKIIDFAQREERLSAVLSRSASFSDEIDRSVRDILDAVREEGDAALRRLTARFDGVELERIAVPADVLEEAWNDLDEELRNVIEEAEANIRRFHERQVRNSWFTDDGEGTILGQRMMPLERVGLYVPGGTAAYPSSVLMNAIPAQVAGVPEIHLVSPPSGGAYPHHLVCATAHMLGIENVYAVGGAQAVGALAYGTETIPAIDKVVGPGNAYVAAAKKMVYGRVDIDSVAGPSEIVVLADETADPEHVAADLLSQAEHDRRASAVLVTPHRPLAEATARAVERRTAELPRREIIEASLEDYGACILTPSMREAIEMVNELAPEHLEIITSDPWSDMTRIRHAGAIFLGPHSSEPVGDYFAGPNHVLPTGGTARYASALGVDDFVRRQSIIAYSGTRLQREGERIARFAEAESLRAHAEAIRARLD